MQSQISQMVYVQIFYIYIGKNNTLEIFMVNAHTFAVKIKLFIVTTFAKNEIFRSNFIYLHIFVSNKNPSAGY